MFSQISPVRPQARKAAGAALAEEPEIENLVLAPFTPTPKLSFNKSPERINQNSASIPSRREPFKVINRENFCSQPPQQTSSVRSTGEKSHPGSNLRRRWHSGGTYVKTVNGFAETALGNVADLQFRPLHTILEETSFRTTPMKPKPTARKTLNYTRKSSVKRLVSGSTRQSLSQKFHQRKTKTTIAKQIACFNDVCNPCVLAQSSDVDPSIAATQYYSPRFVRSVIVVQQWWRSAPVQQRLLESRQRQAAARRIQGWYRHLKTRARVPMLTRLVEKVCANARQEKAAKATVILRIQAQIRGFLIRQKYAEYKTPAARDARQLEVNKKEAATRLQSFWRGYTVRRSQSRKLAERNLRVISLGGTASVGQVTKALLGLDRATRFCRRSCDFIAQRARVELYHYIVDPNSSYTGMLITSAAAGVLLNLVKCRTTIEWVWMPDRLEAFIRAMLRTCNKENDVFVKLATILWVFGNWDRMHYEVIVALPAFRDQMRKMLMLCERQQKMVSRAYSRRKPSMFAGYDELPLPMLNSNWGLDYRRAPNTFVNAVHAIRTSCMFFDCTS